MANLSYQGPLPISPVTNPRFQPFPLPTGIPIRAPKFLQSGGAIIFVLDPVLPPGLVGYPYSQTLIAGGGSAPYTFAVTSGALPGGLSLGAASGTISGTATTSGAFSFTVRATDTGATSGGQSFTLSIGGAVPMSGAANSGYTA